MKSLRQLLPFRSRRGARPHPGTSVSDRESYVAACLAAASDSRRFSSFRRDPSYTRVLEHVSEAQGALYLEAALSQTPSLSRHIAELHRNDEYGCPQTYDYPIVGKVSPTTLRYFKVLSDLTVAFGSLDGMRICEIGGGYGGQCRLVSAVFKPTLYRLVDLQPALSLAQRFLDNYPLGTTLDFKTSDQLVSDQYDLVVSNYAFSELRREVQSTYIEKVIRRAARGYITYSEITPPHFKSLTLEEFAEMLPAPRIVPENPMTHPKNKVIFWG